MPLHLLSKKSWNVYNPASIAKVRSDEAAAAAREESQNERELAWQADVRLALLRGLSPPARPAELDEDVVHQDDGKAGRIQRGEQGGKGGDSAGREMRAEKRRMRRREGEDDTERDIRLAREDLGGGSGTERATSRRRAGKSIKDEASLPLTDAGGHIQLFAPEPPAPRPSSSSSRPQHKDPEQTLRQRQQEEREAGSLRFSEVGPNRGHPSSRPWYTGASGGTRDTEEVGKNAFGREDAGRKGRDAARVSAADPMAVMVVAQRKLKEVERERERWKMEREREVGLVRDYEAERRGGRHRHSGRDMDESKHGERRRRRHKSRSRSRSPVGDRRHRSHRHRE